MNRLPLCQSSMLPFLPSVALSSTKFSQGGSFEGCRTQVRISRRVESDASGSTIAAFQGPACPLCCEHVNDPSLWPGAGQVFSPTGFSWALATVSLERFHVSVILPPPTLGIWKFLGQGSNPSCIYNLWHSYGNTKSLTSCAWPGVKSEPPQWELLSHTSF